MDSRAVQAGRRALRGAEAGIRAARAARYSRQRGLIGSEFAGYGRRLGARLLLRGDLHGIEYVLTPVNIVRYFEFAFASTTLPQSIGRGLDVGSPRLLSLYLAERRGAAVDVINPDRDDAETTRRIARVMRLDRLRVFPDAIADFDAEEQSYDCIWSVSVIEHVRGEDGDTAAMKRMWQLLRPGGTLVVTVPVAREHHIERRDLPYYGLDEERDPDGYFFARYYDAQSLRHRLIDAAGVEPTRIAWFGERRPGHYADYEERWRQHGHRVTVDDPRDIVDNYAEFPAWEDMAGFGVCGFALTKPA